MHLIMAGLSHKTAPVEIREKLAYSEKGLPEALTALAGYGSVNESVIISTCNRTEIYVVASNAKQGKENVVNFLCEQHGIKREKLFGCLYFNEGRAAVDHLFCVAASLDSMVEGEAQILGQVKDAYESALECDSTSIIFNRLFRQALTVGKRVRTETEIGESAVSISYAAVELAKRVFETLEGKTVMVMGAGKMSELTLKHLVSNGAASVLVTNRTFSRAEQLAKKFDGRAIKFNDFVDFMADADIVVSSTGAPHFVVMPEHVTKVMQKRKNRPIFFIDIAVPRDIDPKVGDIYNAFLYDIDDLDSVVQSNLEERRQAAEISGTIIESEIEEFMAWLASLEVVPTIAGLRDHAEEIRQKEIDKHLKRFSEMTDADKNTLNALTGAIVNKLLHNPIIKIKECANDKDGYLYVESVRHLFDLEVEDGARKKRKTEAKSGGGDD